MKYSQFNSVVPYEDQYAIYNAYENKVIFIERDLKDLLEAAIHEGIDNLEEYHPDFYYHLRGNNFLIEESIDELNKVEQRVKEVDENDEIFVLTINPTMNCNFKCWYCYETHVKNSKLQTSMMNSIKLFMTKKIQHEKLKTFTLALFGGEPLLYFKRDVVPIIDHLLLECKKYDKEFIITFTTNGYLVDDNFINYFVSRNIMCHLQISFDGFRDDHDNVRYVSKEKGSYFTIVQNIKSLLKYENFKVKARLNYTKDNISNISMVATDFEDISEYSFMNQLTFDYHRVWQDDAMDGIAEIAKEEKDKIVEKGFMAHTSYAPNNVLDSCYADKRNSVVINYNGDIYKCTAKDYKKENREGFLNGHGDLIWENDFLERRMASKFKNKPCLSCRLIPICNGGCSQHALEFLSMEKEYCVYHGDEQEKNKVVEEKIREILINNTPMVEN
ncbi:radical SAM protein [Flammeovirga sp. EKP202]|uniref:radical SAM/SPASM domain-containing protein n=1 Tax=Flammeovirga sp. EKP202 TaxID=2770592 RepID=UPI00165FCA8F|nr:radical SAM protein [Flammeovirga sp. EKP202]MBD0402558.1 SPASM domain-containing protein [Flammeovirga sp. EKP202]